MSSAPTYSTLDELKALYSSLPMAKAEQLLAVTEAVVEHGRRRPEHDADAAERQSWLNDGYSHWVSPRDLSHSSQLADTRILSGGFRDVD